MAGENVEGVAGSEEAQSPEAAKEHRTGTVKHMSTETIGSIAELKRKDPKTYEATLKSIAQTIIREMRQSADRVKRMMREGQRRG